MPYCLGNIWKSFDLCFFVLLRNTIWALLGASNQMTAQFERERRGRRLLH